MNKKAQIGESTLWIYRFIIIIIIVGSIIFVVVKYYSNQQDIRPLEASLLSGKLISCLTPNIDSKFNLDVIRECITVDDDIFVNITFEDKNLTFGNDALGVMCKAKEKGTQGKNLPYCFADTYKIIENNQEKELNINIVIHKSEKNV